LEHLPFFDYYRLDEEKMQPIDGRKEFCYNGFILKIRRFFL